MKHSTLSMMSAFTFLDLQTDLMYDQKILSVNYQKKIMSLNTFVSYFKNFFCNNKVTKTFVAVLLLSSCSVTETKHFSEPEQHVKKLTKPVKGYDYLVNSRYQKFENRSLPNEFEDSLDHTLITLSLENGYSTGAVGVPLIPFIPIKSGYGHPENKKVVTEKEKDDKLVLHLMLTIQKRRYCGVHAW